MNRYKKILNNSLIFMFGSFGSKLIVFFMLPIYTQQLTTEEYGIVDLIQTSINLLIPIVTLELGQAALRFSVGVKSTSEQNEIFSNITKHGIMITIILLLLTPILIGFNLFESYGISFIILLIFRVFDSLYTQYLRGIGLVKKFAINGIILSVFTVLFNIIFLVIFDFGVNGFLLSLILATIISIIYVFFSLNGFSRIRNFKVNKSLYIEMLHFSIPIIPNSAMWWVINGSTKFFVLFFIGASANGLFAVATKIPTVISMVTSVFTQAWQLSSFEEYGSEDKNEFYTKIFNLYSMTLFLAGSLLLVVLKPLLGILIAPSFYDSWVIVPFLLLAVIYQSFSSFLGTNYTAAKETKGTFSTSVYAGVVSLIASFVFVPILGIFGAGISSILSFVCMFLLRYFDTKKFVKININIKHFLQVNFIYIIQSILLFVINTPSLLLLLQLILFTINLYVNRQIVRKLLKFGIQYISNFRK